MHRWAPRHALVVMLLLAYPVLTHTAVATGLAYPARIAWLCIAALAYLSFPGKWGLAAFAALAAVLLVVDADVLIKLPPVVINLALAFWFGRTLAPGEEPMVSWFARLVRGTELAPDLARYTRSSTIVWTALFAGMAAVALALAVFASRETWSLFATGIDYLVVGVLFVGEFAYRRLRYWYHAHAPLADVVRIVARSGKLAPRRTARK